jgi:hypothetical protein
MQQKRHDVGLIHTTVWAYFLLNIFDRYYLSDKLQQIVRNEII